MCEHYWVSKKEIEEMNLSNCKGEVGPIDMFVLPSQIDPKLEPAVCIRCYQIFGEVEGSKHPDLSKLEEILKSYE